MPVSSSNSHVRDRIVAPTPSDGSSDDKQQRRLSSQSSSNNSSSKAGRLFDKWKVGSTSKRKQPSDADTGTGNGASANDDNTSTLSLAQRLRVLLDLHPVNSPAPNFQPLPTPDTSPTPLSPSILLPPQLQSHHQFPVSPIFSPTSLNGLADPRQSPASSLSSQTSYYSAPLPSSPADAELAALLSSPVFMNGSLVPSAVPMDVPLRVPTPNTNGSRVHTPTATPTPTPMSPARRQSIFNILDKIGSPRARARRLSRVTGEGSRERQESVNGYPASPRSWPVSPAMSSISSVLAGSASAAYGSDGIREIEEAADDSGDDTSIMMYSPLMPTPTSLVSIADSEEIVSVVAVHEEETDEEEVGQSVQHPVPGLVGGATQPPEQSEPRSGWSWSSLWPLSSWFSSPNAGNDSTQSANSAPNTERAQRTISPQEQTPVSPRQAQVRLRRRRVWVPSRTQLSLETMWWGYRIYVPPPVLDALDSTSIETSRRGALLTAALTWFFTNFPVNVLPPTVRPVIIILQGLVPYLGYLGGILSWSWGTVRSYDEGYGVILTATWLLPIALIPSTWIPPEWPGSPRSTASVPLSPTTSQSTPTLSTLSATTVQSTPTLSSLSPTMSQSTPTPIPSSPAFLQSESAPVAIRPEQQQQPFQTYSSSGYSSFSYVSVLSPLPQFPASASFPSPTPSTIQNTNNSLYPYTYGHGHGQIYPATSPVISMPMMSPVPMNGMVMYSPASATVPFVPPSPYTTPVPAPVPVPVSGSATSTPTLASAPLSPTPSMASATSARRRRRDTTTYAPRLATVPLPDDDR
ncbi:hypothetical protein AX15_005455 [Amanita polypyramis BW_CC]|nr:hypothetical protein AX15_005455 [Amanita polypyramis BW_CC]